jgi:hypothetical protein
MSKKKLHRSACLNNPDTMIPVSAQFPLLENSALAAGISNFGPRLAEGRKPSKIGPLAVAQRSRRTMRDALQTIQTHGYLQTDGVSFLSEEDKKLLIIREELLPGGAEPVCQATAEMSLGILYRRLMALLGDDWRLQAVCFRHAAGRPARSYAGVEHTPAVQEQHRRPHLPCRHPR